MKHIISQRVDSLRDAMRREGVHAFIIPSGDPHCSEYVPDHWKAREWITGFNGSAGTAVVTLDDARLWTDSRYFIAAETQLAGTPFKLMKDGLSDTPSVSMWISEQLSAGHVVATCGFLWDYLTLDTLRMSLSEAGLALRYDLDLVGSLWPSNGPKGDLYQQSPLGIRPSLPLTPVERQPIEYSGETASSKLARLRAVLLHRRVDALFLGALDDIAWTCNIRCRDVHCTPVAVSFFLLTHDKATLFIDRRKLTPDVAASLAAEGITTAPYDDALPAVLSYKVVMLSLSSSNYATVQALKDAGARIMDDNSVADMKAVKNPVEVEGFRAAMRRDGVALVRFLRWLEENVGDSSIDELAVDERLTSERARQHLFRGRSFDTIAGYAAHGAIVHYEATPETSSPLKPKGLLLLDSGAQYQDGTTDVTRTISLGRLTDEERRDYTLVLKGHIALATVRFPEGTSGTRIDAFARQPLWQRGFDYGHGTGHGVGSYLSVHEGPHQIRHSWKPAPLRPFMTVTNEPGLYREGSHGVRIENTMLVVPDTETGFGRFCRLEPLTLCPIDTAPIVREMLSSEEVEYLNKYHSLVFDELSPLLDGEDRAWLERACSPL